VDRKTYTYCLFTTDTISWGKANIDIGLRRAAAQVVVAREIEAGLFFVSVVQRERFRIERTPDDLGVRRAGRQEHELSGSGSAAPFASRSATWSNRRSR